MQLLTPPDGAVLVSQSKINTMLLCPAKVGFQLENDNLIYPSEALVFGNCLHLLIEKRLLGLEDYLTLVNEGFVYRMYHEFMATENGYQHLPESAVSDLYIQNTLVPSLTTAFSLWDAQVRPNLPSHETPIVEQELFAELGQLADGRPVWLRGYVDYGTPTHLVDWKSTSRKWKDTKAHWQIQPPLYTILVEQNYDTVVELWDYWIFDKKKLEWDKVPTEITRTRVEAARQTAIHFASMIEAGHFPYTPVQPSDFRSQRGWHCSPKFCEWWNQCEGKFLVVDDKIGEVREDAPSW